MTETAGAAKVGGAFDGLPKRRRTVGKHVLAVAEKTGGENGEKIPAAALAQSHESIVAEGRGGKRGWDHRAGAV